MAQKKPTIRVQLDFADEWYIDEIDELRIDLGVSSRAEVVRNSLAVYGWLVGHVVAQSTIICRNKIIGEETFVEPVLRFSNTK